MEFGRHVVEWLDAARTAGEDERPLDRCDGDGRQAAGLRAGPPFRGELAFQRLSQRAKMARTVSAAVGMLLPLSTAIAITGHPAE